ncbi:MAG TPA: 50S ribosomal protein L23 [Acidobacteriota bacterium]|nr:50S ribosomal protein L23 [Acidobacteriota bacterium]
MEISAVLKHPVSNEKAIRLMESENKLTFVVDMNATKPEIKQAVEAAYKAKVVSVNSHINRDGDKVAFVKFDPSTPAIDVATSLGMI